MLFLRLDNISTQVSAGTSAIQVLQGSQSQIQETIEHLASDVSVRIASATSLTTSGDNEIDCNNTSLASIHYPSTSQPVAHPSSESSIFINATVGHNRCRLMCPCQCHTPLLYTTPSILRNILGSWFMMLSNITALTMRQCDYHRCYKTKESKLSLAYYFPTWFLPRAVSLVGSWKNLSGAGANIAIRMPRIQPDDTAFFRYLETGNLEGVRSLLSSGHASPFDVNPEGRTSLWV
jgi:hypothetical protein